MTVNIYLLGEMRIEFSGHPLRLPTKGVELAAFLALQPNARSSRRSAALALWPDREGARALSNLSTLLWRIKALMDTIGTKFLSWDASHLWLERKTIWVDCWELERISKTLVEGTDPTPLLDRLLNSYQGELGGHDIPLDWITEFREYFRVLYLETLARAGRILQFGGNIGSSRRVFEKIFQIDPANEAAAQELMKIYARDGNGDRVNYVYSTLISHLRRDLGVEPTQETAGLYREIRGRMNTPRLVDTGILRSFPSWFMVRSECDPLRSIFLVSQTNLTRAIGIRGDWGLGKTTLLRRLLVERARWGSSHLIRLPELAEEVESYQCLHRLSLSLADRSGDAPLPDRDRDLLSIERNMMSWLRSVIRREATKGTSLIMFDNIQSADIYSLRIIRQLRKELDGHPIIFVLTWSEEDCSKDVLTFLGEQKFFDEIISLRPFSPPEVSELLGSWGLERMGSHLVGRLTEITGGNPRLLETATQQLSGLRLELFRRTWESGLIRVLQEIHGRSYIDRIARRLALLSRESMHSSRGGLRSRTQGESWIACRSFPTPPPIRAALTRPVVPTWTYRGGRHGLLFSQPLLATGYLAMDSGGFKGQLASAHYTFG
ncbi:MAG: BTAD domain-containing putative transcriptional regulator [Armatimonadota bacterium]|nr:BTAD domain-containing putative transcriptional regulator [Armatimonadota bacterium]MDR7502525.1 BTAD domain-containing putative transcriptional regulator [Armatimonadota bacterium]MDR7528267.1 BTAD domain-containing putative transcriptional regulator [Armatimonadota bacterium]MDR7576193.1 BTAD domain-containing putative transcriptional regulator [Armatimonadota bacterium]